jgi:peptide deformylase
VSVLQLRTVPDPVLRQKSASVQEFDESLKHLIDDLVDTMFSSDGVGIAAPQTGILSRVIICCDTAQRGDEEVFINPEIIDRSGEEVGVEGCLSVPGITGEVKRATSVTVRAQDTDGKVFECKAQDLMARILQHEMDHLEGVLFIDRLESPQSKQTGHSSAARL